MDDQLSGEHMLEEANEIRAEVLKDLEILGENPDESDDLKHIDQVIADIKKANEEAEAYEAPEQEESYHEEEPEVKQAPAPKKSEPKYVKKMDPIETNIPISNNVTPQADKLSAEYNEVRAEFKDLNTPVEKLNIDELNKKQEALRKAQQPKKDPKQYLENKDYKEFSKK